jgi:RNA polymerase sigma-70 factor, ECF subfamily
MAQPEAVAGDNERFVGETERFRRQLLAYCYRMMGSVDDAEDVVQETYLRAWRAYGNFEGRSSVRTWLFRIATNACLTALKYRGQRFLPTGLGAPADDIEAPLTLAEPNVAWLQPIPDTMLQPESGDPAEIVALRDNLRLALIASLQCLTARQRVVLILRDVLEWPAAEVADMIETTTDAVKSTLKRARQRIEQHAPAADEVTDVAEATHRALLDQYISAFQNSDADALRNVLREDAVLEFPPARTWFAGREYCEPFLATKVFGTPGEWRMSPTSANGGHPAAVSYKLDESGTYQPYGVVVLTTTPTGISRITAFGDPELVAKFATAARST